MVPFSHEKEQIIISERIKPSQVFQRRQKKLNALFVFCVVAFFCLFPSFAHAATLQFAPSTGSFTTQNSFTVSVTVSTNQTMNGAEGEVQFPTDKLEVIGVSKRDSIFSLWVQEPSFNNQGPIGRVNFQGVRLNPGYAGNKGKIIDITFRVKQTGVADLVFGNGAVLANDGRGTNIISSFGSGVYTLRTGVPSVSEPPSTQPSVIAGTIDVPVVKHYTQTKTGKEQLFTTSDADPRWSNSTYARLAWTLPSDATGVAMILDEKADTDPGTKSEGLLTEKLFPMLKEGKYYFHIRYLRGNSAGPALHFPVFIDLTPPKDFSIEFTGSEVNYKGIYSTSNPRPAVDFFTDDMLSGVDGYEIKIADEDWLSADELSASAPYILPKQKPSKRSQIVVRAFDNAGNTTEANAQMVIEPVIRPILSYVPKKVAMPRESLVIEGNAAPHAEIEIILEQYEPEVLTTSADENGDWRLVYDGSLSSGLYRVTAKQIISNGAESLYTEPVFVKVTASADNVFTQFLIWLEKGNGYILLVVLIILQVVMFGYYRLKMKQFQLRMDQRIAEQSKKRSI